MLASFLILCAESAIKSGPLRERVNPPGIQVCPQFPSACHHIKCASCVCAKRNMMAPNLYGSRIDMERGLWRRMKLMMKMVMQRKWHCLFGRWFLFFSKDEMWLRVSEEGALTVCKLLNKVNAQRDELVIISTCSFGALMPIVPWIIPISEQLHEP